MVGITPITHITKVMTRNPNYKFGNGVDLLPNIEKKQSPTILTDGRVFNVIS